MHTHTHTHTHMHIHTHHTHHINLWARTNGHVSVACRAYPRRVCCCRLLRCSCAMGRIPQLKREKYKMNHFLLAGADSHGRNQQKARAAYIYTATTTHVSYTWITEDVNERELHVDRQKFRNRFNHHLGQQHQRRTLYEGITTLKHTQTHANTHTC